jgi:hypothetical protein
MAKTFYKYAEREADAYVNWAEIGQNMADMFQEENRVREEKKAALDQASRTLMQEIANKPMGEHESANMASMDLAETTSKNNLIQKGLMERGQITPNDYMKFTQNTNDNIKIAYNSLNAYQENFKEAMAGYQDGKYSGLQLEAGAHAEKFGEWKNVGWVYDSKGNLMMGVKKTEVIDGKTVTTLDQSPGNLTSVQALNEGLKARIPMAKIEEESAKFVASLGKDIRSRIIESGFNKTGAIITTEDILAKKYGEEETGALFEFFTAENQYIKTLAGPPENQASILFDKKRVASNGLPYTTTYSEEEAKKNPNLILKVYNPTNGRDQFKISDAQQKEIDDFLRNTLRRQYGYEEKKTVTAQLEESADAKAKAEAKYREQEPAAPKPIQSGIGFVTDVDPANNKTYNKGTAQNIRGLVIPISEGISEVPESLGYNAQIGDLELVGFIQEGEKTTGTEEDVVVDKKDGKTKEGTKTPKKKYFTLTSKKQGPRMEIIVKQMVNPESPTGAFYTSLQEAEEVHKRKLYGGTASGGGVNYQTK